MSKAASASSSDIQVQELPPEENLPEQPVVDAMKKLAQASSADEKLDAVRGLKLTRDASRMYMNERGFLLDWIPMVTLARVRKDDASLEWLTDLLADLLKNTLVRDTAGKQGIADSLAELLQTSHIPTKINAIRAIGNFCFDNESNRQHIHRLRLGASLLELLESHDNQIIRASCGALLNSLGETDAIRTELLNGQLIRKCLSRVRDSQELEVLKSIAQLLYTFFDSDESIKQFLDLNGLEEVMRQCQSDNVAIRENAIISLTNLAEEERLRRPLYEHGLVDFLFSVSEGNSSLAIKRAAAKTIGVALANDQNMDSLFQQGKLSVFKTWLANDDEEIRAYAALCIGNIARTDDYCRQIVASGLVDQLREMILSSNMKEQNGAIGAFRNLCISPENKRVLGEKGIIEKLVQVMDGQNNAAKFTATIIIKNLLLNNATNARLLIENEGLAKLLSVFESTSHDGMRCEVARVAVNIIKNNDDKLTAIVLENKIIDLLTDLAKSQHAILRAEAYQTLTTIVDKLDTTAKLNAFEMLLNNLPEKLKDDQPPAQIVALNLVQQLISIEGFREKYSSSSLPAAFASLSSTTEVQTKIDLINATV